MIFNKTDNGSFEIKGLIGFVYRSLRFDNLKSYIGFAERDIKKIIGSEVFKVALDHYISENFQAETDEDHPEYAILDELVTRIQYPVAIHAYRRYVPSSDLTHSEKGRQIFVSENEKPAFEWQIEKDNENLISLEHEAIDALLEFLDENIDTVYGDDDDLLIPWGTSEAFKATRTILIPNVTEFEKVFHIGGSRLTFLALVPFMLRTQKNEILSCISDTRYTEILEQYLDGDLNEANLLILDKIRPPMALLALSVDVKRLSSEILPAGIFSNITENVVKGKIPAGKQDRNEIASSLEKDGMRELLKLQEHITRLNLAAAGETFIPVGPEERIDPQKKYVRL